MTAIKRAGCGKCGMPIIWHQTASGRFAPPWEETGRQVMAVDPRSEEIASVAEVVHHRCIEENVQAHSIRKAEWENRDKLEFEFLRQAREDAMPRPCPACRALPFEGCKNRSAGVNNGKPTKWPHSVRYTDDFRKAYPQL